MSFYMELGINILNLVLVGAGCYMMGRNDENRRWADLWFNQWKAIIDHEVIYKKWANGMVEEKKPTT